MNFFSRISSRHVPEIQAPNRNLQKFSKKKTDPDNVASRSDIDLADVDGELSNEPEREEYINFGRRLTINDVPFDCCLTQRVYRDRRKDWQHFVNSIAVLE